MNRSAKIAAQPQKWTPEEDMVILNVYAQWGPRWQLIVDRLPGRTIASVRNRWQRVERGRRARESGTPSRNRCQHCHQLKRGHICFAKLGSGLAQRSPEVSPIPMGSIPMGSIPTVAPLGAPSSMHNAPTMPLQIANGRPYYDNLLGGFAPLPASALPPGDPNYMWQWNECATPPVHPSNLLARQLSSDSVQSAMLERQLSSGSVHSQLSSSSSVHSSVLDSAAVLARQRCDGSLQGARPTLSRQLSAPQLSRRMSNDGVHHLADARSPMLGPMSHDALIRQMSNGSLQSAVLSRQMSQMSNVSHGSLPDEHSPQLGPMSAHYSQVQQLQPLSNLQLSNPPNPHSTPQRMPPTMTTPLLLNGCLNTTPQQPASQTMQLPSYTPDPHSARKYTPRGRVTPQGLVAAFGFPDDDDLRAHAACNAAKAAAASASASHHIVLPEVRQISPTANEPKIYEPATPTKEATPPFARSKARKIESERIDYEGSPMPLLSPVPAQELENAMDPFAYLSETNLDDALDSLFPFMNEGV